MFIMRLGLLLLIGMVSFGQSHAQGVEVANPRLSLGITSSTSGIELEVPITLTPTRDRQIGKIQAEMTFPSQKLTFVKVAGYLATEEDVNIQANLLNPEPTGENEGQGVLEVTLESPAKPLPAGILTMLVFQVSEDVQPEILSLGLHSRMWGFPDLSREITPVESYEGRVSIQEAAVFFGCFFYMH